MTAIATRLGGGIRRSRRGAGPRGQRAAYLYLVPAFAVMSLITIYPLVYQVYMSFTNTELKHLNIEAQNALDSLGLNFFKSV